MISRSLFFQPELDPNCFLSPPKKRRVTQGSPINIPVASKTRKLAEDSSIFRLSAYKPKYSHKTDPTGKVLPSVPKHQRARPSADKLTPQFQHANCAWKQFPETPNIFSRIGEGFSHEVYEHIDQPIVYKIPNLREMNESAHNHVCFKNVQNMQTDYKALMQAQKSGLFPQGFRLAKTSFIAQHAIIVQEKCDRMLEVSDLQNLSLFKALQKLFALGYQGFHNFNLSRKNLGISKDGELLLIDFREKDGGIEETFNMKLNKALSTYSLADEPIFYYLDPRI